jgi:hypothetical protein
MYILKMLFSGLRKPTLPAWITGFNVDERVRGAFLRIAKKKTGIMTSLGCCNASTKGDPHASFCSGKQCCVSSVFIHNVKFLQDSNY